jgi:hypothetical protein
MSLFGNVSKLGLAEQFWKYCLSGNFSEFGLAKQLWKFLYLEIF